MAANPFSPFPRERGPLKMLVYGDPGTEKTRRALALSGQVKGPTFVIDMEDGASDYGDIVADGGQYLRTKSVKKVMEAMEYLSTLKPGELGLFIGDAVPTVLWQQLQAGHIAKMGRKAKPVAPEDVIFDVGAWGSIKRIYGDFMTRFLHLPCPSILIARGKEKIDDKGTKLGYGYDGEKSTDFLAKTVIEARGDYDLVVKDRTGTFRSGRHKRLDFSAFIPNTGTASKKIETDTEAAENDVGPNVHPSYVGEELVLYTNALAAMGTTPDEVAAFIGSVGGADPSQVDGPTRRKIVGRLQSEEGAQKFLQWKAARVPHSEAA